MLFKTFNEFGPSLNNYHIEIHQVFVSTDSAAVNVTLETNGTIFYKMYTTKTNLSSDANIHIDTQEPIYLTCGAGTFVSITYHERLD